ncbi:LIM and SH3 domain protein Lasp isoform X1 [Amyelois transitella]|uniref:LIM and SH3 domain protein Lasp isoform X1 n=1 Tax=Amyelois transitella TaxID=680683 RepID=UPI00067AFC85|nr:LIM and SH3 domain protein Lasp isoform X1 [Amyelois transitella]
MNKTCARCEKTVYPTEELKCLDKVWHKGCFKCQECGMTLNMRTYKGYGKLPYCEAHVPKAKHTTMAETPELKRIAENTKIQSNVKYHADFEKSKGKFTQVADDPETLRIKANTKIISNVAYHGDLEKKAQMEKQRQINENGELVDVPTDYQHQIESYATEMLPPAPPSLPQKNHYQTPAQAPQPHTQPQNQSNHQSQTHHHQSQTHHHQSQTHHHQSQTHHHQSQTHHQNQSHQQPRQYQNQYKNHEEYNQNQYQYDEYQNQYGYGYQNYQTAQPKIGRIQDYDPVSDGPRMPPNTQRSSATLIYNSTGGKRGSHQSQQQQGRQIGRVTDMDPLAAEQPPTNHQSNQQVVFVAMYDYEANDSDEVSFREGDYISNVTAIDEGWMTGQVLRTGHTGMLPANYVERVKPNNY